MRSVFGVLATATIGGALYAAALGCSSSNGNCVDGFGGSSSGSSGGCSSGGSGGGSGSGSGSGSSSGASPSGTMACGVDLKTTACASCVQSSCCGVTETCANDSACAGILTCVGNCNGNTSCEDNCATGAPSTAQTELTNMANCWSGPCSSACGGSSSNDAGAAPDTGGGCATPGETCSTSSQCCQSGSNISSLGAVCITQDDTCHALCTTSSQCTKCCAQLQGSSNGVCDGNANGTDTCLP
jgi:hypothetical protein